MTGNKVSNYWQQYMLQRYLRCRDYDDRAKIIGIITFTTRVFGEVASMPCLLITFIVYTILPELRNIHGLTLRGYVGCQFMMYATKLGYAIAYFQDLILPCAFWGTTMYFFTTASYFWLNVMCFDIWWTFGRFRPLRKRETHNRLNFKQFIFYSIYVWGSTTSIITIWVILTFGFETIDSKIFGHDPSGWCYDENYWYLHGPITVTFLCNMILFVITVTKMICHNKDTAHHLEGTDSRRADDNKSWFILYMKLFFIMGIKWSSNLVFWLGRNVRYMYHLLVMVSAYQGVIIFVMFICKRKVLRRLIERCRCRRQDTLRRYSRRRARDDHNATRRNSSIAGTSHEQEKSSPQRF